MAYQDEWEARRGRDAHAGATGMGALSMALLFGSAAVAMALILTPLAENRIERMAFSSQPVGLDMMATGTVGVGQPRAGSYTIRRSVLQPTPASVCIIRDNGMRSGDC